MSLKIKTKLLIVDDERDICRYEKNIFEKRNFKVSTAETGSRAITLAKTEKPDIALIDIHMSKGVSGLEILEKLLRIHPACKCIIVTWDKEKALEAKKKGAVAFVIKPVELEDLELAITKVVKSLTKK